jgi:hypothetical protein
MLNGFSPLGKARQKFRAEQLRRERARLAQKIATTRQEVSRLETELVQAAAPDRVDAKRDFQGALFILSLALLLAVGFVFYAELSLRALGFDWGPAKFYFSGVVFWLGTVVSMHIYLGSKRDTAYSDLPWLVRVGPLVLILLGIFVLAVARGLLPFLPTDASEASNIVDRLVTISKWSGLISQLALSLGLDLSSGVLGWVGERSYTRIKPIWSRYLEIKQLEDRERAWEDQQAEIDAELESINPRGFEPTLPQTQHERRRQPVAV